LPRQIFVQIVYKMMCNKHYFYMHESSIFVIYLVIYFLVFDISRFENIFSWSRKITLMRRKLFFVAFQPRVGNCKRAFYTVYQSEQMGSSMTFFTIVYPNCKQCRLTIALNFNLTHECFQLSHTLHYSSQIILKYKKYLVIFHTS
jgi:hypothetical protein